MNERMKMIGDWLKGDRSVAELSRFYVVSRKTAYKWLGRYAMRGPEGLRELGRSARFHPNATPAGIEERVLAFRHRHPRWGPRKLIHRLRETEPGEAWPSASTAGTILKRHGLTIPRRRRLRTPASPGPRRESVRPNDVWAADFKGWFRAGDGSRVNPLTISDTASRYLIGCRTLEKTHGEAVKLQFERAFREFGLPWVIRTDNGPPFASVTMGGLSRLAVWWIKLGIRPERIRPGHPEENGRHERFHRSLKEETADPPRSSLRAQQAAFDRFRQEYNEDRPHEALGMDPPARRYKPSERAFPERLPPVEYGPEFAVRRVRGNGEIKWAGELLFLSESLIGELAGLEAAGDGLWRIQFGPVPLAVYDEAEKRIKRL